jgi:hypothetical protein
MTDDFFTLLERQLEAAELGELNRGPALRRFVTARRFVNPRRLLEVPLAAAAAAGVAVVVLAILGAIDNDDADRRAQPVSTVPGPRMEVIATDAEHGIRFGLDGRVLTVQLLSEIPDASYEAVNGARISATCSTAPAGGPPGETTLTQLWRADYKTQLIYRFPRDVSSWCRLEDESGSTVASVTFPGVRPGAREQITATANNWARVFASTAQACNAYTAPSVCKQIGCELVDGKPTKACKSWLKPASETPSGKGWAEEHRGAKVQKIAISGDRADAMLADRHGVHIDTVELRRTATGQWLVDMLGGGPLTSPGLEPCTHRRATCG